VYANKTISWRVSWPVRIMCAILQLNSLAIWKFELYLACGLSGVHPDTLAHLRNETPRHLQRTDHRRRQFKQERETKRRIAARSTVRKDTKGKGDYYLLHEDVTSREKKQSMRTPPSTKIPIPLSDEVTEEQDVVTYPVLDEWAASVVRTGEVADSRPPQGSEINLLPLNEA
jgi:hypothetical protein